MNILSVEPFDEGRLLAAIRTTRLAGFDGALVYQHASIEIARAQDPDALAPAQRYVLTPAIAKILELRAALLGHGVDIFGLCGGAYVRTSEDPDEAVPVIPPIVEESLEPDGRVVLLINDGIHRIYAARSIGAPISVITVRDVPRQFPYYALALNRGWADVVELHELPDGFQKKEYRDPTDYRALFRDFNAVFPGVQKARKRSNPAHLVREG